MRDVIGENLNIAPDILTGEVLPPTRDTDVADNNEDFDYVRKNMYEVIEKSMNVLDTMISIAETSEGHKEFDTLANLIKTTMDANKDLAELRSKANKSTETGPKNITNNTTIFSGTTLELQKALENMREKEKETEKE